MKAGDLEESRTGIFNSGGCGEFGHRQLNVPMKTATKIMAQKENLSTKRRVLKETTKERDIRICQKFGCFNCGEYGHYT